MTPYHAESEHVELVKEVMPYELVKKVIEPSHHYYDTHYHVAHE